MCVEHAAYIDVQRDSHGLPLLMPRHMVTMHLDPVLMQLCFCGPDLEALLPADAVLTQIVLMPEVLCNRA